MSNTPPEQPEKKPDPWGRNVKKPPQQPPDLDVLLRNLKNKVTAALSGKPRPSGAGENRPQNESGDPANSSLLIALVLVAALVIWGLAGIFIISPGEQSVITRFGRYVETVDPGPHWIPRFIQTQQTVNVQQVQKVSRDYKILTQDENIIRAKITVQYRIDNPKNYLFNAVNPEDSLDQAMASAVRQVVGHTLLDDLLTTKRDLARDQVKKQLMEILALYNTGLLITDVTLQVEPPEEVTAAFDDAVRAREDEQAYINKADAYSKQILAQVKGEVSRILEEAGAYQRQVVLKAQADIASYLALLPQYQAAPQVTRERLYLNAMESVLGNSSKLFMGQKNGNPLVYLPLDKMMSGKIENPSSANTPTAADTAAVANLANNGSATPSTIASSDSTVFADRPSYSTSGGN